MNDSGTRFAVHRGEHIAVVEESVDQRARVIAERRMRYHTGTFVHNQELIIFVDDIEGDIFRTGIRSRRARKCHLDDFTGSYRMAGLDLLPVNEDGSRIDGGTHFGPRGILDLVREIDVDSLLGLLRRYKETEFLEGTFRRIRTRTRFG